MTDSSAVPATTDRITELLAAHEPDRYNETRCICKGKAPTGLGITGVKDWHRAHVASLLAVLVADAQTDAWDEGHEVGGVDAMNWLGDYNDGPGTHKDTPNPYRKVTE